MIALLKQSITINIESEFLDSERSVTKSMVIDFQIPVGTGLGCIRTCVFGLFFVDWHMAQPST